MTNAASVSKPRTLRIAVVIAAALSLVTCSRESRSVDPYLETVMIPAGSLLLGSRDERASRLPRRFDTEGFHLGRVEVTCGFFERYLRDVETSNSWSHPQFEHRDGVLRAKNPAAPLAWVTQDEAQHFCDWLTWYRASGPGCLRATNGNMPHAEEYRGRCFHGVGRIRPPIEVTPLHQSFRNARVIGRIDMVSMTCRVASLSGVRMREVNRVARGRQEAVGPTGAPPCMPSGRPYRSPITTGTPTPASVSFWN